jgi:hypothetical protein
MVCILLVLEISFGLVDRTEPDSRFALFKRDEDGEEQILHYTILADRPPEARLPNGTIKRRMSTIIQRSPLWVCRLIGELFYVYAS